MASNSNSLSSMGFNQTAAGVTAGGVLSQLIAIGAADNHLTANPDVTYWRVEIQKCTNYAMESIISTFNGTVAWGGDIQTVLNRTGDLIYWMYLLLDVPGIAAMVVGSGGSSSRSPYPASNDSDNPTLNPCNPCGDVAEDYPCLDQNDPLDTADFVANVTGVNGINSCTGLKSPYCNWVDELGFAAISRVSFSIGGQVIDTLYSHYMHMWEELSGQPGKRLEEMIGKRFSKAQLVADSSRARRLYVPLPFYFTRHSGNALPLVALQFHSIQINVTLTRLQNLIQVSEPDVVVVKCINGASTGSVITSNDVGATLDTTYIYLDIEERDMFAVGSFNQLITQVQQFATTSSSSLITAQLNFNHPTLELIWAVQRTCTAAMNNTFDYSGAYGRDPILNCQLTLNGLVRFSREAQYFRMVQPWQHHTNIPNGFIYVYSFAVFPEDVHPSGSLNFSRIDNANFQANLQPEIANSSNSIVIFGRCFNCLRYREGLGGLLYSN